MYETGDHNQVRVTSSNTLKDKSGVGIIVDYSRDYTTVNGV